MQAVLQSPTAAALLAHEGPAGLGLPQAALLFAPVAQLLEGDCFCHPLQVQPESLGNFLFLSGYVNHLISQLS